MGPSARRTDRKPKPINMANGRRTCGRKKQALSDHSPRISFFLFRTSFEGSWQLAEDFTRKKEIRAYMYKLREQRLKEFYASNDSSPPYFLMDKASATFGLKKSTVTASHGDSLVDQSFESFKTKEIRDSESPTRFGNAATVPSANSGWQIKTSEEVSDDGKTHTMHTTATTQGTKELEGGRMTFAGHNLESHSEHFDGDESNFVHSKGDQSSTVLVEDSVIEDADSGRTVAGTTRSTTTSSVSSTSRVVRQQQQNGSDGAQQLLDATDFALDSEEKHGVASSKINNTSSSTSTTTTSSSNTMKRSSTNTSDEQCVASAPKELSKDPERVREAFRLAQGAGKVLEREETMVNATTKMITETKRLDDGTTVTTRTYEKLPTAESDQYEHRSRTVRTQHVQEQQQKKQEASPTRTNYLSEVNSSEDQQRSSRSRTATTTSTTSQRISVEVDAAHDSFARSLRSISPTGSVRSVRSNATLVGSGRTSVSPDKGRTGRRSPSRESDQRPDYMRSTFTSERKVSGFREPEQPVGEGRSPSPRKVPANTPQESRGASPVKQDVKKETHSEMCQSSVEETTTHEQEVDSGRTKPPLVRSETYEERCRKILGMPHRPMGEEAKVDAKTTSGSIFSTYDNTVTTVQQQQQQNTSTRSELREQRKKIEQEIRSIERETLKTSASRRTSDFLADERDSMLEERKVQKESSPGRKSSVGTSKEPSPTRQERSPVRVDAKEPSPTRKPTMVKEVSPVRKPSVKEPAAARKSPEKEPSPARKELTPTRAPAEKEVSPTRKSPEKEPSPKRMSPTKEPAVTRASAEREPLPTRKPSVKEVSPVRQSPSKEPSLARETPVKDVSPSRKPATKEDGGTETATKTSKATVLVEQRREGRNISVAEITIVPVMEVSEVRTARSASKVLTKQSSDTKFDRRTTTTSTSTTASNASNRAITNKSSSDFDVTKRRSTEVTTSVGAGGKQRTPATSPDKRRPAAPVAATPTTPSVKQNHITVAKIKINPLRKPQVVTTRTEEWSSTRTSRSQAARKLPEPETDPESSKDTGISDNSEVEETVERVEVSATGTACCRHSGAYAVTDRKDSAPVVRTTGAARASKSYARSSSDNHLRATNVVNRPAAATTAPSSNRTPAVNGRGKVERPVKHVATKTINLSNSSKLSSTVAGNTTTNTSTTTTFDSDHLDNVVIDIQQAKSSREPTPNKLVPIPVSPDTEDTGKPRYPDAVQEPDDERAPSTVQPRVNNIPIFEEATNEYVGCEITEVDEQQESVSAHATRITNLDRVTEDDESLLSVTEKVSKFVHEARRLQESSTAGEAQPRQPQPVRFVVRHEYDDIDEHLKSDECLLSVSDKVTKFISTAEEVKKIRTSGPFVPDGVGKPGADTDVPVSVTEGDECLLSVNEKVNRFASRIGEARGETARHTTPAEDGVTDLGGTEPNGELVAEKVSKFAPQKSPELVKNAMRSTARHTVGEESESELAGRSTNATSITERYRTATVTKQAPAAAPAAGPTPTSPITLRSTEAVKKAKEIFEKGQTVQDARQRDILSRPSIWEERRAKKEALDKEKDQGRKGVTTDVKLTDIGVFRKQSSSTAVDGVQKKPEEPRAVEPVEPEVSPPKSVGTGSRRDSGGAPRAPAYIRDTVSSKKDLFEKRISSSRMQVEYTTQTSQEASTESSTAVRRQSLKQTDRERSTAPSVGDGSKPSYMNHTVASLEHINANQRRESVDHGGSGALHEQPAVARNVNMASTTMTTSTSSSKFGVELKRLDSGNRTSTTTTTTVAANPAPTQAKRKSSGTGATTLTGDVAIEDIFELEVLERMLEAVTGYEQRRRIRAQIRLVKKQRDEQQTASTGRQSSTTVTTTMTTTTMAAKNANGVATKRKDSSPTRTSAMRKTSSTVADSTDSASNARHQMATSTTSTTTTEVMVEKQQEVGKPTAPVEIKQVTTDRFGAKASAKDERPIWATSNILKKASENTRTFKGSGASSLGTGSGTGGSSMTVKKTVTSSSSSYHTKASEPKSTTDCITSSYGVGPMDENGLPLFGIRALKKKATPVPPMDGEGTTVTGTIVTETLYAENGGPAVGKRSTTHYAGEEGGLKAITRTEKFDSTGAHSVEEVETIEGSGRTAKVVRKGSVKELTERFVHRESSGSLHQQQQQVQQDSRSYPKAGLILRSSAHSHSSRASTPATDGCSLGDEHEQVEEEDEEQQVEFRRGADAHTMTSSTSSTRQVRSFLNDTTKVTDVQDVLQRMSNADHVEESGDTAEDREARALLNKFLGASVLMSGVESLMAKPAGTTITTTTTTSTGPAARKRLSLVSKLSSTTTTKTHTVKSSGGSASSPTKPATVDNLDEIWDEAILKQLLESSTSYDDRRKIRARIRQIMAEKEACADIVAIVTADLQRERQLQQQSAATATAVAPTNGLPQGESLLLPLLQGLLLSSAVALVPPVEDSGTESGEDLRLLAAAAGAASGGSVVGSGGGAGRDAGRLGGGLTGILHEVSAALERLQLTLRAEPLGQGCAEVIHLDAEKRNALLALITRLQQGLLQPDKIGEVHGDTGSCGGGGVGDSYDDPRRPPTAAVAQRPSGQVEGSANGGERTANGNLDDSQTRPRAVGSSRFSAKRRTNRNSRHTVGVSREELADARRFIEEMVLMDGRQPQAECAPAPEKTYLLQKQHSLGTVLGSEPAPQGQPSAAKPAAPSSGSSSTTTPATAFAMKRPSQFVPKEMQNLHHTTLDKMSGTKHSAQAASATPVAPARTKPSKEKLLLLNRQSLSVDQALPPTSNGRVSPSGRQDSVAAKPIDLHKHKPAATVRPQQPLPAAVAAPEEPFKKPTQTAAQRALVKKYSFNDGSSTDEDEERRALRKPDEPKKTAEQMVLRNKITPTEAAAGQGGSLVINTVQKIVSRETKPTNEQVGRVAPRSTARQGQGHQHPHHHGPTQGRSRTPDSSLKADETLAKPVNKYTSKKLRMKRANTIDIPKNMLPNSASEGENDDDDDEVGAAGTKQSARKRTNAGAVGRGTAVKPQPPGAPPVEVPDFKPRTENDLKFMAFLQKQNQQPRQIWSNPVREHVGSNNWTNKFGHLKSNFEQPGDRRSRSELPPKYGAPKPSAMSFWKQAESSSIDEPTPMARPTTKQTTPVQSKGSSQPSPSSGVGQPGARTSTTPNRGKNAPGTYSQTVQPSAGSHPKGDNTADRSVVEGKLVLPKATGATGGGTVNQFSHASASAFKPIPKKLPTPTGQLEFKPIQHEPEIVRPIPARVTNATGLVKQIVATGFKETPEVKPEPMQVQLGLVRSLAAQGYQETPYVPLPKIERTPTHKVLNYNPRPDAASSIDPAPAAPWVGKRASDPASNRVASIAATKFTANPFGHNKQALPAQQPLTYQGSLKYAERPLAYQVSGMNGHAMAPYEKRPSLPDVSAIGSHLGTYTFTDYTHPESVSTFSLNRSDSLTNPENEPLVLTSSNSVFSPTTAVTRMVPPALQHQQQQASQISYLAVNVDQQSSSSHSPANPDEDDDLDDVYDYDDLDSVDSQEMRVVSKVMKAPQGQQATYSAPVRSTHLRAVNGHDGPDAGGRGSLIAQSLHSSLKKIKDKSPTPPKARTRYSQELSPAPITADAGHRAIPSLAQPPPQLEVTAPVPSHAIYNNVHAQYTHTRLADHHHQPLLARTKSSHNLTVPVTAQPLRPISSDKQRTVEAYFTGQSGVAGRQPAVSMAPSSSGYQMARTASSKNLVLRDKSGMAGQHHHAVRPVSYAMGHNMGYSSYNGGQAMSYAPQSAHFQQRNAPADYPAYKPHAHQQQPAQAPLGGGLLRSRTMPHIPLGSLALLDENNVEDAFEELMNQSFAV
ncbi:AGAP000904-PA-like protein [Anopheles sinensis]|uniref:AGAP000904-PA-like protein n=1 Tax=Anopheles sinensis TaxID=74873 RepID=A0A084WFS5_ANOSI|nr:AGAP000904-PA-like protein [Anopheles sinensis]